jgi:hypothetical protein
MLARRQALEEEEEEDKVDLLEADGYIQAELGIWAEGIRVRMVGMASDMGTRHEREDVRDMK